MKFKNILLIMMILYSSNTLFTMKRVTSKAATPTIKKIAPVVATMIPTDTSTQSSIQTEQTRSFISLPKTLTDFKQKALYKKVMLQNPTITSEIKQNIELYNQIQQFKLSLESDPELAQFFESIFNKYDIYWQHYINNPTKKYWQEQLQKTTESIIDLKKHIKENIQFNKQVQQFQLSLESYPEIASFFEPALEDYNKYWQLYTFAPNQKLLQERIQEAGTKVKNIMKLPKKFIKNLQQYLQLKSQLSPETLEKYKNEIEELTNEINEILKDPHMLNEIDTKIKIMYISLTLENTQFFLQKQKKIHSQSDQQKAYNQFQTWTKQQPSDIQKLLEPVSMVYDKTLKNLKQHVSASTKQNNKQISNLQKGLLITQSFTQSLINYPQFLTIIINLIINLQKQHNSILTWAKKQSTNIQPIIDEYNTMWNQYEQNPISAFYRESFIKNLITLQSRLMTNPQIFKYIPGFTKNIYSKVDLEKLQEFFDTTTQLKPEFLALRHFEQKTAPSGEFHPLCSQDKTNLLSYTSNGPIDADGYYNKDLIALGKQWHDLSPSAQLHIIKHEYRHRLQDISGVLDKRTTAQAKKFFPQSVKIAAEKANADLDQYETNGWMPTEQDADHFATSHISCTTCLKINQAYFHGGNKRQKEGYYGPEDFEPHIQLAHTLNNPTCPAHTLTPGDEDHNEVVQELEQTIEVYRKKPNYGLAKKIQELDKKSGKLLDHIPDFNKDIINAIHHHRQLKAKMAQAALDTLEKQHPEKLKFKQEHIPNISQKIPDKTKTEQNLNLLEQKLYKEMLQQGLLQQPNLNNSNPVEALGILDTWKQEWQRELQNISKNNPTITSKFEQLQQKKLTLQQFIKYVSQICTEYGIKIPVETILRWSRRFDNMQNKIPVIKKALEIEYRNDPKMLERLERVALEAKKQIQEEQIVFDQTMYKLLTGGLILGVGMITEQAIKNFIAKHEQTNSEEVDSRKIREVLAYAEKDITAKKTLATVKTLPYLSLKIMQQRIEQIINTLKSMNFQEWPKHTREFLSQLIQMIRTQMSNLKQAAGHKISQINKQRLKSLEWLYTQIKKDQKTVDDFLKTTEK